MWTLWKKESPILTADGANIGESLVVAANVGLHGEEGSGELDGPGNLLSLDGKEIFFH